MDHDPRAYLWDAKKSAEAIAEFVSGEPSTIIPPIRCCAPRSSGSSKSSAVLRQLEKAAPDVALRALASRSVGYEPRLARFDRGYAIDLAQLVYQLGDGSTAP